MENAKYTNQLINESSPYLLQHAHNPVDWYPWGETALNKAKNEDKPLLISIGYAACHWCHVMEKESFEKDEVAEIMNNNFVCIKVDREERPDIDQVYMEAVQIMTGTGGWPLNCFAMPNGSPFYGGTYFQTEQWKHILISLANMYRNDRQKIITASGELINAMKFTESIELKYDKIQHSFSDLTEIVEPWKRFFDKTYGGNNRAPKFPMPVSYEFLLKYTSHIDDNEVFEHVFNTLNKIACGGIYDQAGGGFARYSVDAYWKVPHFEKMLYDNAQLVSLYSLAYRFTKNTDYKRVVSQSLEFIERELYSTEGAFYSSLDADSEGEEGKFYIWEKKELEEILGNDAELYCNYYQVTNEGNWEHKKNILHRKENTSQIIEKYHLSENELYKKIDTSNRKVLNEREKRIRPGLDDKILTSWNSLMLKGFVDAYLAFDENSFLEKAIENANFLTGKMMDKDYRLSRNYKNGKASINAFLDDYAFTIEAFVSLYQATFEEKWLSAAHHLTEYAISHFYDSKTGMFYYTSDLDPKLIARKMEINDNVIPASNSAMARNLYMLGHYLYNDDYSKMAHQMFINVKDDIKKSGAYYSNWAILLADFIFQPFEIVIVGENAIEFKNAIDKHLKQNAIYAGNIGKSQLPILNNRFTEGKTTIYICHNRVCKMPVFSAEEALKLLDNNPV